ncbi:GNAT family N-acetyltransferase [Paenibacillus sp. R14(2021)]|uniref:GNAT family N-acetyltransferase n=1 Tax=Paenibacillus sp. R14(2021) TaxID=2859228 RepID=UPI001C614B59|nr:GNAT family N-acetyltransferase [Paenibacillus sp. R14(2021)]
MEHNYEGFLISDDKALLKIDAICGFLSRSYWANQRPVETILKSIANSECFGIYDGDRQVGFARIVTDGATVYYLCDVYVDEAYRGTGVGKKLIEIITEHYEGMLGLLGTRDAHGLYEKYGFTRNAERFMLRKPR